MKTLIVSYLPRGERSHTKKLLDTFLAETGDTHIEHLDLLENLPDVFLPENLGAYIKRSYLGETLTPEELRSMACMDRLTAQLKSADIVVLATPMHNFSLPAVVKAYFDAVMLKGETWEAGPSGYFGLMKGKKALVLMASGGIYEGQMASWEHGMSLARTEFSFMGFEDIRHAWIAGVNMMPDKVDQLVEKAREDLREIIREWY
jgi:FMN-dependent NADH-azoreductase